MAHLSNVFGGLRGELHDRNSQIFGKKLCDHGNPRGVVGLAPARHGRLVRSVRFQQKAIERKGTHYFPECFGVLESDDAVDADKPAHHQQCIRHFLRSRETVGNAFPGDRILLQNPEGVLLGFAGVQHHRKLEHFSTLKLFSEHHLLGFCGGEVVVVVQPHFTNGPNLRVALYALLNFRTQ